MPDSNDTPVILFVKFHKVAGIAVVYDIMKQLQLKNVNENYYVYATNYCSLPHCENASQSRNGFRIYSYKSHDSYSEA